jgi:hypothetical protein
MAENESLDLADSRRWMSLCHAVCQNKPLSDITLRSLRALRGGLRAAFKGLIKKEVPLNVLLSARHDPRVLRQLVTKARHDYAHLFAETALADKNLNDAAVLENFIWAVWDKMRDQITKEVVPSEHWSTIPDVVDHLNQVATNIEKDIHRLAGRLADNPAWLPSLPKRKKAVSSDERLRETLQESLLGVSIR